MLHYDWSKTSQDCFKIKLTPILHVKIGSLVTGRTTQPVKTVVYDLL